MRKHLGDEGVAIPHHGRDCGAAETRASRAPLVVLDEFPHLIDRADAAHVALTLRAAPREQAVPPQDDAVAARTGLDGFPEHQRQLEARTLPGDPGDPSSVPAVELLEL